MFPATRAMFSNPESKVLLLSAVSMVALGTVVYMFLEGWTAVDALYFSVVALATVGFGDLHPTTDASRLHTRLLDARIDRAVRLDPCSGAAQD